MAALTANRPTKRLGPDDAIPNRLSLPVAAGVHIYEGAQVAVVDGYAQPATSVPGAVIVGRAEEEADNSGTGTTPWAGSGAAGNINVEVRLGTYEWDNSSGPDAITEANIGESCYAVDDHTVALTDGDNTRSFAGVIMGLGSDGGVYVCQGPILRDHGVKGSILSIPVTLAEIAAGNLVQPFVPGFEGHILAAQFVVTTPATTAAKAATLQPQITPSGGAAANTTGGAIGLTTANCGALGDVVAGSAITGANAFGAKDSIGVVASGVTAFAEGAGVLLLTLGS